MAQIPTAGERTHKPSHWRSRAQDREAVDPSERTRPIPVLLIVFALAMVLWGAGYVALSGSFGRPDLGDRRTPADLAGPTVTRTAAGVQGKQVFAIHCVACHQADGRGLPGVFPPLDGSEWVAAPGPLVVNILLRGISGELTVAGKPYQGTMPSFQHLSDAELAAVANYVRTGWSNRAAPVADAAFAAGRAASTQSTPLRGEAELQALARQAP